MVGFLRSSVGKKYLMGMSGLVWALFIMVHMLGNMLILVSTELYNIYGHSIVSNKPLLYLTEFILCACIVIHVFCAVSLTLENKKSKGSAYSINPNGAKSPSFASQMMAIHGSIILIFIILHLCTFKYGPEYFVTINGVEMRDLSKLVLEVFHQPLVVGGYVISLILLGFHLTHGVRSIFQSFGLLHPSYQPIIRKIGVGYAVIVSCGFISQPLFVFLN